MTLVERLEAASGPDRELDAEIWLACTPGVSRRESRYVHKASDTECVIDETRDATGGLIIVPAYTGSLDAAMTLVPEGCVVMVTNGDTDDPRKPNFTRATSLVGPFDQTGNESIEAATPALALCAAALRARATQETTT